MKSIAHTVLLFLVITFSIADSVPAQKAGTKKPANTSASFVKSEKEEFDAAIALPPAERIEKLRAFVASFPRSTLKTRALELIVSARATIGDEKLKAGDAAGGIEQFRLAVAAIPAGMSDNLFTEVVSQIPANLYLRGQHAAAIEVAGAIESHVKDNGKRMLTLAAFYIGVEAAEDAMRVADLVIKLTPESSPAYQARAAAHRLALRLDESREDYARALDLSPQSEFARRSLAELRRATGKTEEAVANYREILKVDAMDEFARTGLVVSLFELGRKDEAERELETALKDLPNSLALLSGIAYWFAAHNDSTRAIEFAERAVRIESRYTWSHIALARALLAQRRTMEAERPLIIARSYGRFPTLDYEMASVLTAAGLYGEAASTLSSFVLKGGKIETFLAGRILAQADSFTELLAPERRASIFQFTAADSEANARTVKALLVFSTALNPAEGRGEVKEADVLAAAEDFINGADEMRAFRRLYVASRLLERHVALTAALEMMGAITSEVEAALSAPTAAVAVMGEELRSARAQAIAHGSTLNVPEIPRNTLSNLLRGRIEDLAGWTLFNQGKYAEAIVRLRRATSVLPDKSIWWRNSMWHLGASLDADGKGPEALEIYYASYMGSGVDPTRRAAIEGLYRRINGSLDGLDEKIGASAAVASNSAPVSEASRPSQGRSTEIVPTTPTVETKPADAPVTNDVTSEPKPDATETKTVEAPVPSDTTSEPRVDATQTKTVEARVTSDTLTEPKPNASETIQTETAPKTDTTSVTKSDASKNSDTSVPAAVVEPTPAPTPSPEPTPESTPGEVPPGPPQPAVSDEPHDTVATPPKETRAQTKPATGEQLRERRVSETKCEISISESALTIENNGGRAIIEITLDGAATLEGITASTSDWSALAVFPEPKSGTNRNVVSYSVTSISKKAGTYKVTVKSPCGTKDVTVTVR